MKLGIREPMAIHEARQWWLGKFSACSGVTRRRARESGSSRISDAWNRFAHCLLATTETAVSPEIWQRSWSDVLTSYAAWEQAGEPDGFLWASEWALAYPGASTVVGSDQAAAWSEKLGRAMHEILIETNTFTLRLICHDLRVEQLAVGDPDTGVLTPVDPT